MKKILIYAVILALPLVYSCNKKSEENKKQEKTAVSETSSAGEYVKTDFYFKLPDSKGGEIKLEDYKGKPLIVFFFTKNCPYCQKAAPYLNDIHQKYKDKGLKVIGVSVKSSKDDAIEFSEYFNLTFPVAYDGRKVAINYGISGVPFIYLLDKKHELKRVWAGYDEEYNQSIEKSINSVL